MKERLMTEHAFKKNIFRIFALSFLLAGVVMLQRSYDSVKPSFPEAASGTFSPDVVRLIDMGFHPAVGAFSWISTMPEILDIFNGKHEYVSDLAFVNGVDPKFSYPYAFSVLVLPVFSKAVLPDGIGLAARIAQAGIQNADPDWRIPYYMAANYYLILHDKKDAITYYDITARTPGVPAFAARFSLNFGIGSNDRQTTEELWKTIRDSTNDTFTKNRAEAYIEHLQDFDYLDAAAKAYKANFGAYPSSIDLLVTKKIIPQIPQDPFGFTFIINPKTGAAGIDLNNLPAYLLQGGSKPQ